MALTLEIGGTDRTAWLAVNSASGTWPLGGRASCNAVLEDRGRGYSPTIGNTFVIKDGSTKLFAGHIRSIVEFCHPPTYKKQFRLRVLDYNHICDRRRLTAQYGLGETAGSVVGSIVALGLSGEGIDTTNVATGPAIDEPIDFRKNTVTEALNKVSAITGKYGAPYLWYIDWDKKLYFSQFASNTAPFSLTDSSNNFFDFELEQTLDNYRNVQHARTEYEIAPTITESFTGNGVLIGFITSQQISDTPTVTVNSTPKTIGEFGVDHTGKDFYWIRDGFGIFNQDHATLTGSDTLVVVYTPPATNIVTVEDAAEIAARAAAEGGSGRYEAIDEQRNLTTYEALIAIAEGDLAQHGTIPVRPSFKTRTAGLAPGQRISVNLTRHGINTSYLIEQINFRWIAARTDFIEWSVSATSLDRAQPARTAWMEKLVEMARIGAPPQQVTGTSGGGSSGGTGGWSERPSGNMNGTNTTFTLVSAPSPTAGLILAVNGIVLRPGTDYTLSGNTITLNSAPSSTDWLRAWYDFGYLYNAEAPTASSPLGGIFDLAAAPLSGTLLFFVNGLLALNGTDYTLSSNQADFVDAPDASDWELAWYTTSATSGYSYNETPSGTINGTNTVFTLAASASGVMVVVNGVLQAEGVDYTRSGGTITFLIAPASGDWIRVWSKQ